MTATRHKRSKSSARRLATVAFVITVALLIVVLRLVEQIGPERQPGDRFIVHRIIDGDTVELLGGDKLRLLAIDTPERGEPFFDEATSLLGRLVLGKKATIKYADRRRDRYGRLLGYLYIDSLFVNQVLLDSGLAYVYLFGDDEFERPEVAGLLEAQRRAIGRGTGLWSVQHEPEEYYVSPVGSYRLHRPSCSSVRNLAANRRRVFSTREEGLAAGLSPCRNCKP